MKPACSRNTRGKSKRSGTPKPRYIILDPAVAAGQWTWDWRPGSLVFRSRLKKRTR